MRPLGFDNADKPPLPDNMLHLWEHAALLYHSYEWQEAVDTFSYLASEFQSSLSSNEIDYNFHRQRTYCLLNAAMIQARLGDYKLAAIALELAMEIDFSSEADASNDTEIAAAASDPLTPFLLGLIEWELSNAIKAEACFRLCLVRMANRDHTKVSSLGLERGDIASIAAEVDDQLDHDASTDKIDYAPDGLNYILDSAIVRYNIRIIRMEEMRRRKRASLFGVPAECIFEAPKKHHEHGDRINNETTTTRRHTVHLDTSSKLLPPVPRLAVSSTRFLRLNRPDTIEANPTNPWINRPRTPYIPRDARGEPSSLVELTRWIQSGKTKDSSTDLAMIPKDAGREEGRLGELVAGLEEETGRKGPSRSMAMYGKRTGLESSSSSMARSKYDDEGDDYDMDEKDETSLPNLSPTSTTGMIRPHAILNTTAPDSPPYDQKHSLEFLLPRTYRPAIQPPKHETHTKLLLPKTYQPDIPHPRPRPPSPTPRLSRLSLLTAATIENPLAPTNAFRNLHTAASETSSIFRMSMTSSVRRITARNAALRALIGSSKTNPERGPPIGESVGNRALASAMKRKKKERVREVEMAWKQGPWEIESKSGARPVLRNGQALDEGVDGNAPESVNQDDDDSSPGKRTTVSTTNFFRYVAGRER